MGIFESADFITEWQLAAHFRYEDEIDELTCQLVAEWEYLNAIADDDLPLPSQTFFWVMLRDFVWLRPEDYPVSGDNPIEGELPF